jgi:hypothetical protein
MKLTVTVKPDPIVEFESQEDLERWLECHKPEELTPQETLRRWDQIMADRKAAK